MFNDDERPYRVGGSCKGNEAPETQVGLVNRSLLRRREPWQAVGVTAVAQRVAEQGGGEGEEDKPAASATEFVSRVGDALGRRRTLRGDVLVKRPPPIGEDREQGTPRGTEDQNPPVWNTEPAAFRRRQLESWASSVIRFRQCHTRGRLSDPRPRRGTAPSFGFGLGGGDKRSLARLCWKHSCGA